MADETTSNSADALIQNTAGAAAGADQAVANGDAPAEGESASTTKRATETIREEASKIGSEAKERARAFANDGKARASGALDEMANLMRSAAGDVDAKLGEDYGRYARSAADGVAGFAESLRGKEIDDLIAEAGEFVKKSPAIAVGTAAALGFVMARLIKSGIDAAGQASEPGDPASNEG
jgi:ElaB/YqjD/DUF883 family membrane-anchored ribosome-binding protein